MYGGCKLGNRNQNVKCLFSVTGGGSIFIILLTYRIDIAYKI